MFTEYEYILRQPQRRRWHAAETPSFIQAYSPQSEMMTFCFDLPSLAPWAWKRKRIGTNPPINYQTGTFLAKDEWLFCLTIDCQTDARVFNKQEEEKPKSTPGTGALLVWAVYFPVWARSVGTSYNYNTSLIVHKYEHRRVFRLKTCTLPFTHVIVRTWPLWRHHCLKSDIIDTSGVWFGRRVLWAQIKRNLISTCG